MGTSATDLKINGDILSDGEQHDTVWSLAWNPKPLNGAEHMLASSGDRTIVWQYKHSKWTQFAKFNDTKKGTVRCSAWHFDGTVLATGSSDSKVTLRKYDQATESFVPIYQITVPSGQVVMCLTWSKEGILLTCTEYGYICILGINGDGHYHPKCRTAVSDIAKIKCITWHPNGKYFAVGGYESIKILKVHKTGSNMTVKDILKFEQVCNGGICGICYSCNGTTIACAGRDGSVTFWKVGEKHSTTDPQLDYHYLRPAASGTKNQSCFDWSRCQNNSIGFLFASGSNEHEIRVYAPIKERNKISYPRVAPKIIDAHNGPITDLKWHHEDPGLLASASQDGSIKIWQVKGQTKTKCYSLDEVPAVRHKSSRSRVHEVPADDEELDADDEELDAADEALDEVLAAEAPADEALDEAAQLDEAPADEALDEVPAGVPPGAKYTKFVEVRGTLYVMDE